ncbi:MAG: RICIN domain-containing protein [Lapillicoccus sp.]
MRAAAPRPSRRPRLVLLGAVLAALLTSVGLTSAAPAQAASGTPIVGVASGRCLDVTGNTQAIRTRVIIWDCNNQANQAWTLTAAGELRVFDGDRCLDVSGSSLQPGGTVQIYTCTGGANQKWRVNADQTIVGVQSGLCLDVTGGSTARGAYVQTWTCHGRR